MRYVFLALAMAAACRPVESAGKKQITIWWAEWDPARGLQELGNEFEKETGIAVKVHQIPWPSYQDQVFLEFGNKQTSFDIVVGDSQWIGRGATSKLYLDLTDWLPGAIDMNSIHPRAKKYLMEYQGRLYAAPCETDAMGFAYRKDWFEDASEKAAFKARYGRELAVPKTWEEFKDAAEFFHRPDRKTYGCALITGRDYDDLTMGFQQIMWAFGGSWGENQKARGFVNSPGAVAALEFAKEMMKFTPPGGTNIGYVKSLEAFTNGTTAMTMNYFAFFPTISNQMKDRAGFFVMPMKDGRRTISLGGQGFSISTKAPPARQELAKRFIAWFLKREVQEKWIAKPAGFTANKDILASEAFRRATPYNGPFAESMDALQDFWNVPAYNELLSAAQQRLGEALDGVRAPREALDRLAEEHEKILKP